MNLNKTIENLRNSKSRFFNLGEVILTEDLVKIGIIFRRSPDYEQCEIIKNDGKYIDSFFKYKNEFLEVRYSYPKNQLYKYKIKFK